MCKVLICRIGKGWPLVYDQRSCILPVTKSVADPGSGAFLINVDPNLLPGLLWPPHHIQVHALLLLVTLVHVQLALIVPLIVWIPDVIIIIVIIIFQLVRNLGGGEPLDASLSCPETKKIFSKAYYMILLTVFCVLSI
jgi:hypothetical protein